MRAEVAQQLGHDALVEAGERGRVLSRGRRVVRIGDERDLGDSHDAQLRGKRNAPLHLGGEGRLLGSARVVALGPPATVLVGNELRVENPHLRLHQPATGTSVPPARLCEANCFVCPPDVDARPQAAVDRRIEAV